MDYPEPPELFTQSTDAANAHALALDNTLSLFDLSSSSFPFTSKRLAKIHDRRKQLEDELFVDYLLKQAGIAEPKRLFPPKDKKEFRRLVEEILSSDWGVVNSQTTQWTQSTSSLDLTAGIKRSCLIYYLLAWWGDGRHLTYSLEQRISGQFAELTHAHFLLDIGNTAEACSLLCTPLIVPLPTLSAKVFHALSLATDADPNVLVVRYARMAKPELNGDVLHVYMAALARVNFIEAWSQQRLEEEDIRQQTLETIFNAILNPRPLKTPLHNLASLPLQLYELSFLKTYTVSPPTDIPEPSLAALQSLVILRLTHEGDYAAAVKLNRDYTSYAEQLLHSDPSLNEGSKRDLKGKTHDKEKSKGHPHAYESMEKTRPGVLLAQKQEEWRETLKESVALLPLEHRRVLEAQLHEGSMALASFGSAALSTNAPATNAAGLLMDMSWEAVSAYPDDAAPLQSTPPRTFGGSKGTSPMPPVTPAQNIRAPSSSPHPSSPIKKTSRNSLGKSAASNAPVETNTIGRMVKPPTPKRSSLVSYLTPLRTPIGTPTNRNDGAEGIDSLADRSMAPPPSTGRLVNKNPFFDPSLKAIQNLILGGRTPAADKEKEGDVEMKDGEETEDADDIVEDDGEGDSFVISPRQGNAFVSRNTPYPNIGGLAALSGGLLSATSIVQIKKAQERAQEREQQETERAERERVERERKQAELVERRARLEAVRRSLGGGGDASFGSASGLDASGGPAGGKRKRDRADVMSREDEGMANADVTEDDAHLTGRGKRKADGGAAVLVKKALATSAGALPAATRSITSAGRSSRSGALVPPTSVAPSISVTTAPAPEESPTAVRRSSRISNTSGSVGGSQTGSNKGPSPSPEIQTEDGDETADEDDGDMSMPGAYVLDEDESVVTGRTRRSSRKTSSAAVKPVSKSKAKKPTSSGSASMPAVRRTRSSKATGVPEPIAEDTADEEPVQSTSLKAKGRGKAKGPTSGIGSTSAPVPEDVMEEVTSPTDEGGVRRSSRRLTALVAGAGGAGSGTESTGGRKGRKA